MGRIWRVHHPDLPDEAGASFDLTPEEGRHVNRVLRLRPGEPIAIFDGAGTEWRGTIEASGADRVSVRLDERVEEVVEPELKIVLFQALVKPEHAEWLLQKATEVGVSAVVFFSCERAERRAVAERRLDRWRRIVVEACKQCGRRRVPELEMRAELPSPPPGTRGLLLQPGGSAPPIGDACAEGGPFTGGFWLAVGPEGGFASREVASWCEAGWRPAGLGPRTLRAETAGVVAAAILLHREGDLGTASGRRGSC